MNATLLDKKPLVDEYLEGAPKLLSSFSFVNVFSWTEHFDFQFKIIDGCLCVFASNGLGSFMYLPPLGKIGENTINRCFSFMKSVNGQSNVSRIENVCSTQLQLFDPGKYSFYKKDYEYCYYKEDLIKLTGNSYKSKRSSFNQFVNNYQHEYLPYSKEMFEECSSLFKEWSSRKKQNSEDDIYLNMLDENIGVHKTVLEHYEELGLIGRVVLVDGRIRAYTFGYPLGKDVFCVLFEIADCAFKGLPAFIFRKFCSDSALKRFKFINVMDSFGMKNVGASKMSYHPRILFSSYIVIEKNERI